MRGLALRFVVAPEDGPASALPSVAEVEAAREEEAVAVAEVDAEAEGSSASEDEAAVRSTGVVPSPGVAEVEGVEGLVEGERGRRPGMEPAPVMPCSCASVERKGRAW